MPVTDFFGRITLTILVIGCAFLGVLTLNGATPETMRGGLNLVGGVLGLFFVVTIVCAIWEAD